MRVTWLVVLGTTDARVFTFRTAWSWKEPVLHPHTSRISGDTVERQSYQYFECGEFQGQGGLQPSWQEVLSGWYHGLYAQLSENGGMYSA
jgi:hypothetical protein